MNDEQLLRYSRQILLPQIDVAGQQRLLSSTALIIGAGGLGSPVCMYLAGAGVGKLIIADGDTVELANLQRQIAHTTADIGQPKSKSAASAVYNLNPEVITNTLPALNDHELICEQARRVDLVIDCSDNFATRFAVNRACLATEKPLVSAAVIRWELQVATFSPTGEPCYRCIFGGGDVSHEGCSDNGVIAPLPGIGGSIQALEAIKLLANAGEPLIGRMLVMDTLSMRTRTLKVPADPNCPNCAREGG
ncbi:sulfur carrier protein adenylyltransferase ThiF [Halorhodospira halochloris]|uniref:Molybdopterin-synthase adenylyltransferase n=1 Tax=Halorhodospira halochloris TaxID=1052 RepID=A0A110B4I9_HALHR|nr:molybdopterin-synthase adenylyltransferase MoeB [Halorhodospira halochloris]MBK1651003.1 molybdopterin-synthase adenylyltransferase MoeB [Halorhodospira halochloris]MCG5547345.1 molybdopterin-synthase adenylyltransferase MoeB [Halorhodospira halochloris]BAU56488.1 sulfur carrier protein adenylyltransferase ThiF [Halorhodospira halochloris]